MQANDKKTSKLSKYKTEATVMVAGRIKKSNYDFIKENSLNVAKIINAKVEDLREYVKQAK